MDNGIRSIAFPSISTGVYSYPIEQAVVVAVKTVRDFVKKHPNAYDDIVWVLFSDDAKEVYDQALSKIGTGTESETGLQSSAPSGKKPKATVDTRRLRNLSDQLSELVEELDDIKEDLNEILSDLERSYDEDYADGAEKTPFMKMDNICSTVDGAYTELNEALDEIEGLL